MTSSLGNDDEVHGDDDRSTHAAPTHQDQHEASTTTKRWKTPWYQWVSLAFWAIVTALAFPYVDSSVKSIMAITGPLGVVFYTVTLIKFYSDRRRALGR